MQYGYIAKSNSQIKSNTSLHNYINVIPTLKCSIGHRILVNILPHGLLLHMYNIVMCHFHINSMNVTVAPM